MAKKGSAADRTLDMWHRDAERPVVRAVRRPKWISVDGERRWVLRLGRKDYATIEVDRGTGATAFIATVRDDVRTCWSMAEAGAWVDYKLAEHA